MMTCELVNVIGVAQVIFLDPDGVREIPRATTDPSATAPAEIELSWEEAWSLLQASMIDPMA